MKILRLPSLPARATSARRMILLVLTVLAGCSVGESDGSSFQNIAFDRRDTVYFAPDSSAASVSRFSGELSVAGEPSFRSAQAHAAAQAFRFLWRRSFGPHIIVRVVMTSAECEIITTSIGEPIIEWNAPDARGVSTPHRWHQPPILRRDSSSIAVAECRNIARAFARAEQWNAGAAPDVIGLDGDDWVFELLDASGHRAFSRFSPGDTTASDIWQAGKRILCAGRAWAGDIHECIYPTGPEIGDE